MKCFTRRAVWMIGSIALIAGAAGNAGAQVSRALTVAVLTFVVHRRLPYKKMLVLTGVMLGAVLLVMVGEQAQEMQQAGWLSETRFHLAMPDWLNLWFGVFPTLYGWRS